MEELLLVRGLRRIYLIDNSPERWDYEGLIRDPLMATEADEETAQKKAAHLSYIWNKGKNLGYGAGHNIAIRKSVYNHTEVHLVMNSDILVGHEDIEYLYNMLMHNPQIGLISPHIIGPDGSTQRLCKLLPTPLDVFGRRFLPKSWMRHRNERYTLQRDAHGDKIEAYDRMLNVPYLSGCFMMLRTEAALQARLFDERYFMYPEDIDLTRTIHRDWLTVYCPDITITHNHAAASYHSLKMLWIHVVNMCRYFNKWGWLIDKERRLMNRLTIEQLTSPSPSSGRGE